MQQPCKKCGYESPEQDKFCRQCGDQFAIESEFSAATTLNHGRVESHPPVASVGTGRFPPSVGDMIAGDTERYYSTPQYVAPAPANIERPPVYAPLPLPPPSRLKSFSGFMKGFFIFLLVTALIVTTGIAIRMGMEADEARRRLDERIRAIDGRERPDGRAQNAWEQMERALQLANEAAERAASAGATLSISGDKQIDLSKYAYPGAQVEAMIDSQGNEALSLLARDKFDEVQKFYERLFGKPVLQVAVDRWGNERKRQLFQSPTLPTILIKVEEIERSRVKISILNSFLRFPRVNEAQARI
ncbi:MAG TPA: zinc ribbon domain-containing protein [Blastocatellia bacterium]|nr:zinc ribbon domain-containing protein [Blastocatellia bacterium]